MPEPYPSLSIIADDPPNFERASIGGSFLAAAEVLLAYSSGARPVAQVVTARRPPQTCRRRRDTTTMNKRKRAEVGPKSEQRRRGKTFDK